MQRRKFLIGTGALAAGSAAAVGSGAFSLMSADRDADIDVVNDDEGLIGLVPGNDVGGSVYLTDNPGELKIDFSGQGGDAGVNVGSQYQIGNFHPDGNIGDPGGPGLGIPDSKSAVVSAGEGGPADYSAFGIVNNDSEPHEITLSYQTEGPVDGTKLYFQTIPDGGPGSDDGYKDLMIIEDGDLTGSVTGGGSDNPTPAGSYLGVSILVDARDGSTNEDLSGTLTISAD